MSATDDASHGGREWVGCGFRVYKGNLGLLMVRDMCAVIRKRENGFCRIVCIWWRQLAGTLSIVSRSTVFVRRYECVTNVKRASDCFLFSLNEETTIVKNFSVNMRMPLLCCSKLGVVASARMRISQENTITPLVSLVSRRLRGG